MQKSQPDKILIIGTGGLALSFSTALVKCGIYDVYSEGSSSKNTIAFCKKCKTVNFNELENKSDLIILLAVPDSQIEICAKKYAKFGKLLVHFSGTTPLEILTKYLKNGAVCWPLESFSKSKKVNLSKVTCAIGSSNDYSNRILFDLINSIKAKSILLNNEERMKLHLTAVMLNNFTYHLFTLIKNWTKNEEIDATLLNGLFKSTISSFYNDDEGKNQTGPAKRNDKEVLNQHLQLLKDYPELQNIYNVFTKSIINKYSN
jgi:predicted short-subunit dehydrogenase-like oxidoreductase (DUF2520 family)